MSIEVNWANPYEDRRGQWLRGNLHAHSSPASSCGKVPMDRLLAGYAEAGYDFLSVSDVERRRGRQTYRHLLHRR